MAMVNQLGVKLNLEPRTLTSESELLTPNAYVCHVIKGETRDGEGNSGKWGSFVTGLATKTLEKARGA